MKAALAAALLLTAPAVRAAELRSLTAAPVDIPGGAQGIGFDDLGYAPELKKVLVPGGRTGQLFLIDPVTRNVSPITGFTEAKDYTGGHGEGVTSADAGNGLLFAADRGSRTVVALDGKRRRKVASAKLGAEPDYVRWVDATSELWVTEPGAEKIETFALSTGTERTLRKSGEIAVRGGPESLVIDQRHARAYTHEWNGATVAIAAGSRKIQARWPNGCDGSRGIALDAKRGFVFAGCAEGKAVVLDSTSGKVLSSAPAGAGVDVIAFSPELGRLYVPGAKSATMTVFAVSDGGGLSPEAEAVTARHAHCVAADDRGGAWVCDPDRGRLLYVKDQEPARTTSP